MHSKNPLSTTDPSSNRRSLAEQFADAMNPREENLYLSWMKEQFWSIDEFSALMGGITPKNYKNGTKGGMVQKEGFLGNTWRGGINARHS